MQNEIEQKLQLKIDEAQKQKGAIPLTNIEKMVVYMRVYNSTMLKIEAWAEKELQEYHQNNKEELKDQFIKEILR